MHIRIHQLYFIFIFLVILSCNSGISEKDIDAESSSISVATAPPFDEQLAYSFVAQQVEFGPRYPGSEGQKKCADYLQKTLSTFVDTMYVQDAHVTAGDGTSLPCINIIGAINPAAKNRILLLAHWDARKWADEDAVNKDAPILAADDGASGVGVLMALAKSLKEHPLANNYGVDILLVDAEDYGKTEWGEASYGLGTQYWAKHPHVANYKAVAGILLDMVGATNARFPQEAYSMQYASSVVTQVWQAAADAGYGSYFVYEDAGNITDDHYFVNTIAGIPTIDIINLQKTGFAPHWHTQQDNMNRISKSTLKAVGQTLLQYLHQLPKS
jgi:glutaminyl-peptide cyclotransferase